PLRGRGSLARQGVRARLRSALGLEPDFALRAALYSSDAASGELQKGDVRRDRGGIVVLLNDEHPSPYGVCGGRDRHSPTEAGTLARLASHGPQCVRVAAERVKGEQG